MFKVLDRSFLFFLFILNRLQLCSQRRALDSLSEAIENFFLLGWRHPVQRLVRRVDRLESSQARVPCEAARAEDHRQDADPLCLSGVEQRRQFVLIKEPLQKLPEHGKGHR